VTANDSTQTGAPVTCNGCEHNSDLLTNRAGLRFTDLHCRSCHENGHRACAVCGECLPARHRWDRFYCSSSCRVRGKALREEATNERVAWEEANPEAAAQQEAKYQALRLQLQAITSVDPQLRSLAKHRGEARRTAERCSDCDKPFEPGATIYRRALYTAFGPVLPYCEEHCCDQTEGRHNRDLTDGTYYPTCACPGGLGDRHWLKAEPCVSCGRLVRNHARSANPYRFTPTWTYQGAAERIVRTYCSTGCKRTFYARARASSLFVSGKFCAACEALFTPKRSDSRYCSSACRQKAYRQRSAR
jgi:hypothetical protein